MDRGSQFRNADQWVNDPLTGLFNPTFITQLTGTGANSLAAVPTVAIAVPYLMRVDITGAVLWKLQTSTASTGAGVQRPNDYNGATNTKVWFLQP